MTSTRRHFLQQLGFGIAGLTLVPSPGWSAPSRPNRLPRSRPEAQGVAAEGLLDFINAVENAKLNLHSLMVVRHGHVVAEGWWAPYAPDLKHTLYSLSKSFTSTAVGLAVAEGRLTVDDKVVSFFKDDLPQTVSANLAAMRIRDLLTMTTGHDQDTTGQFRAAPDGNWVRAFLAQPVAHPPGTHFVYNSGATYLLSAILQKLTGQTLLAYLQPRLLSPLGIDNADWEVDPRGIHVGGWGLRVRTEDIAKFGQLYLQKGVWQGKQLVPADWIAEATRSQTPSTGGKGDATVNDWVQGYGYQFWRCRHAAYRGDGAFGQYCLVLPDEDAVVAITSETGDMQAILNEVWTHLLPALQGTDLTDDRMPEDALKRRLKTLALPYPVLYATSPTSAVVSGRTYQFDENSLNLQRATVTFGKGGCVVRLRDNRGDHQVSCGINRWHESDTTVSPMPLKLVQTPVPGETRSRIAGSGTWTDVDTFVMTWRFIETAHYDTVTLRFSEDSLTVTFAGSLSQLNKTTDARPVLHGRAVTQAVIGND